MILTRHELKGEPGPTSVVGYLGRLRRSFATQLQTTTTPASSKLELTDGNERTHHFQKNYWPEVGTYAGTKMAPLYGESSVSVLSAVIPIPHALSDFPNATPPDQEHLK